jgi:cardiolipin synthase
MALPMGLANWLTLLRIVLIPVFVSLLVYRRPGAALGVFALAAITDLLDGWVARRRRSQSRLGAFLDPMADKLLLTASFVTLTYLRVLPFWVAAVVISRDVILVIGALLVSMVGVRIHPRPTWAGKAATLFQVLTVVTGLLAHHWAVPPGPRVLMWIAAGFTVISGLQYVVQGMRFLNAAPDEPGAPRPESREDVFLR